MNGEVMSYLSSNNTVTFSAKFQRGLSLIEMMVAMTIGLLLLLGLSTLLVNSSRSFKRQDDFARMQENGAYALNTIGRNIRMAGFNGVAASGDLVNSTLSGTLNDDANPCGPRWMVNTSGVLKSGIEALFGYSGLTSATVNTSLGCINSDNFVSTSPILVVRGADGIQVAVGDLQANHVYIQSDHGSSVLFRGGDYAGFGGGDKKWINNAAGTVVEAPVYEYKSMAYYLRPCSRPSAGGACANTDDGGRPIPTLVRQELAETTDDGVTAMIEQPVAEGIERMSILYGIDSNTPSDGVPDQYVSAPTAAQWSLVVALRVAVLVRSPTWQADYDDSGKTYDLGGGVAFTCAADDCHYHRHVFAQTFQVRNLAQRLEKS